MTVERYIQGIKRKFLLRKINKDAFINEMYDLHLTLQDYADNLASTEIREIRITDRTVIFKSRPTSLHPGNLLFKLDLRDRQSSPLNAFNFDRYEGKDAPMIFKLSEGARVIFDVGANVGWYTMHMCARDLSATVHAFEPVTQIYNELSDNRALNSLKNANLNNFGLADSDGYRDFFFSEKITGAASMRNIIDLPNDNKMRFHVRSLDSYIAEKKISRIDFMKCDVEGAELLVLKGGLQSIREFKPKICAEILRKWSRKFGYCANDILLFLAECGYLCFKASGEKLVPVEEITDETVETNFFFLHGDKHLADINFLS